MSLELDIGKLMSWEDSVRLAITELWDLHPWRFLENLWEFPRLS